MSRCLRRASPPAGTCKEAEMSEIFGLMQDKQLMILISQAAASQA